MQGRAQRAEPSTAGGRGGSPRVAVMTLTMDRLEYTTRMVESIREFTRLPFDHFIVDNGSSDGTPSYLRDNEQAFAGIWLSETNLGIDGGVQRALEMIGEGYDYVVKVDNDCEFIQSDWLQVLIEVAEAFDRRIVLGPYVEGLTQFEGGYPRERTVQAVGHPVGLSRHVGGLCVMAPADTYRTFGLGGRSLHGEQDVAFSIHVRLDLGYQMGYVEDLKVRHMDTTEGQQDKYPDYFRRRAEIERSSVLDEHPVVTRMARPVRKLRHLQLRRRAGLLECSVPVYLARKVTSRLGLSPTRSGGTSR